MRGRDLCLLVYLFLLVDLLEVAFIFVLLVDLLDVAFIFVLFLFCFFCLHGWISRTVGGMTMKLGRYIAPMKAIPKKITIY